MSTPVSKKNITEFNSQLFPEDEIEVNTVINPNTFFPCGKFKKLDYGNKKNNKRNLVFSDENNVKYSFNLYNDKDIFEKNDIIKKGNTKVNTNEIRKMEGNSDDEEIQMKHNSCVIELGKAFDYINNHGNFFSEYIKNRKQFL